MERSIEKIPGPAKVAVSNLTEYSQFTGLLKNLYKSQKDAGKKLAFNLLGSLMTNTEEDGKVFKEGEEGTHGLLNDIKAAAAEAVKKASFGKRKRGPSASLKRMCKKHGVRLMVKRGKKRVYKSSKVLKGECQRKLKNKLKKNFGRKKIKRSGIMPPRKTKGRKRRTIRKRLSSATRGARRRASAAARYARRNKGRIAGGLAGLGALGLAGLEASRARGRYLLDKDNADLLKVDEAIRQGNRGQQKRFQEYQEKRAALASPTLGAFRRGRGKAMRMAATLTAFSALTREQQKAYLSALSRNQLDKIIESAQAAKKSVMGFPGRIRGLFSRKQPQEKW